MPCELQIVTTKIPEVIFGAFFWCWLLETVCSDILERGVPLITDAHRG